MKTRVQASECKETKPGERIVLLQALETLEHIVQDRLKIIRDKIQKMAFWDFTKDPTPQLANRLS